MATVISITQQKGGAGKTSLAVHLGVALSAMGRRVVFIDCDPQKSLTAWHIIRRQVVEDHNAGPDLVTAEGWRLPTEVARQRKVADIIIIDTPPHAETAARLAVRESDRVLLPVQPTPLDLWATRQTLELIAREGKPCQMILNRVPPRGRLADTMENELKAEGLPITRTRLGNRQIYAQSIMTGRGVTDMPGNTTAHTEIAELIRELDL